MTVIICARVLPQGACMPARWTQSPSALAVPTPSATGGAASSRSLVLSEPGWWRRRLLELAHAALGCGSP